MSGKDREKTFRSGASKVPVSPCSKVPARIFAAAAHIFADRVRPTDGTATSSSFLYPFRQSCGSELSSGFGVLLSPAGLQILRRQLIRSAAVRRVWMLRDRVGVDFKYCMKATLKGEDCVVGRQCKVCLWRGRRRRQAPRLRKVTLVAAIRARYVYLRRSDRSGDTTMHRVL